MTIEKDARALNTEARQAAEQLGEKVLSRAQESMETASSVTEEKRELITQQRQNAEHLEETMLSRSQESLEKSEDAEQ